MKAIVSFSGGMDSATLLAHVVNAHGKGVVLAVGFCYGSKHNRWENLSALQIAGHYGVPYRQIDLAGVMSNFKSDLLLTGGEVPEGHYEADSMRRTVVPGRNIIFASVLAGLAMSEGADSVYLGIHAGDHHIYPDCRPVFFHHMKHAILTGTEGQVNLHAPFLHLTKAGILKEGFALIDPVPYHLTRTCYKDQPVACGKCGSCQERLEAFRLIGQEDPIPYESREVLAKDA